MLENGMMEVVLNVGVPEVTDTVYEGVNYAPVYKYALCCHCICGCGIFPLGLSRFHSHNNNGYLHHDNPLLAKFFLWQELKDLKPKVIVEYDRIPFICTENSLLYLWEAPNFLHR